MNKRYRGAVFMGAAVLIVGVTSFLLFGGSKADSAACHTVGSVVTHRVEIKNSQVNPKHITAKRCEKLLIVNDDKVAREMAFGVHEQHTPYDGVEERVLNKGQNLEVTLDKAGTYTFHDHLHDQVQGSFTVR